MIEIFHRVCGFPAFKYTHLPVEGEKILRENTFHLNGTVFGPKERLGHCESCGWPLVSGQELMPPPLKVYDVFNLNDMEKLYPGGFGIDETA